MALKLFRRFVGSNIFRNSKSASRSIMTSSYNFDKIEEELTKNPYYEKYASKIEALKKTNPDDFNSKLKDFDDKNKPKVEKITRKLSTSKLIKPKHLKDIMKMDLIQGKNSDEISQIWHEYHIGKDCVANIIGYDVFKIMENRCLKYPTFIHPVPRDNGYEFYMSFFDDNTAHFTPLRKYKELKENSPECLEIHYYTELIDSKKIVLIRGTYDKDELSNLEANCLASSLQLYYSEIEGKRANLLESFTNRPDEFLHMDLIADFEAFSKPKSIE